MKIIINILTKMKYQYFIMKKGFIKKNKEYKIKMSEINIWKKYKKIQKIGISSFECVYKGKNKEKGNYVIIKEIEKKKFNECYKISEEEFMNLINKENLISIIEIINSKDYYYSDGIMFDKFRRIYENKR